LGKKRTQGGQKGGKTRLGIRKGVCRKRWEEEGGWWSLFDMDRGKWGQEIADLRSPAGTEHSLRVVKTSRIGQRWKGGQSSKKKGTERRMPRLSPVAGKNRSEVGARFGTGGWPRMEKKSGVARNERKGGR